MLTIVSPEFKRRYHSLYKLQFIIVLLPQLLTINRWQLHAPAIICILQIAGHSMSSVISRATYDLKPNPSPTQTPRLSPPSSSPRSAVSRLVKLTTDALSDGHRLGGHAADDVDGLVGHHLRQHLTAGAGWGDGKGVIEGARVMRCGLNDEGALQCVWWAPAVRTDGKTLDSERSEDALKQQLCEIAFCVSQYDVCEPRILAFRTKALHGKPQSVFTPWCYTRYYSWDLL